MTRIRIVIFIFSIWCCLAICAASARAEGGVSVIGGLTREMKILPGAKIEGKILLHNSDKETRDVKVYQTDYFFIAAGTTSYGEPGSQARSNAAWITFTPSHLSIAAGETTYIYYTVQVPQDAKLVGTYWSVLMVEVAPLGALELPKSRPDAISIGIRTVMRYAIQMVTHIGDTGKYAVKFTNRQLLDTGSQHVLTLDIENTGEHGVRPLVWAEIYDEKGVSLGRFESQRQRIYPGCSARFQIDVTQLPPGLYNVLLIADNGDENVFGTRCQLDIK